MLFSDLFFSRSGRVKQAFQARFNKDKCWRVWENVTDEKLVCDEHYGTFKVGIIEFGCFAFFSEKTQLLSQVEAARADRFTGAECMCDLNSRGNGFDCCERRFRPVSRFSVKFESCCLRRSVHGRAVRGSRLRQEDLRPLLHRR